MKTAEYKTATGQTPHELDAGVNRLIKEGFQPYAGPYSSPQEGQSLCLCQAMVKNSELAQQKPKLEAAN